MMPPMGRESRWRFAIETRDIIIRRRSLIRRRRHRLEKEGRRVSKSNKKKKSAPIVIKAHARLARLLERESDERNL